MVRSENRYETGRMVRTLRNIGKHNAIVLRWPAEYVRIRLKARRRRIDFGSVHSDALRSVPSPASRLST
jgi:hypothetical protein